MPKRYSANQIIKALQKLGFTQIFQKGSHIKMRGIVDGRIQTVIIPNHRQIATGTFSSIVKKSNFSKQTLEDQIK